jgi:hypothetical protein
MNLGSGILKTSIQKLKDENFHLYNSLVLTDALTFQRTHFWIPRVYQHDAASDEQDYLQNNERLKIAILLATNECTKKNHMP